MKHRIQNPGSFLGSVLDFIKGTSSRRRQLLTTALALAGGLAVIASLLLPQPAAEAQTNAETCSGTVPTLDGAIESID